MTTKTDALTIAWKLREKHEDQIAVDLVFYRAEWFTGDDDDTFTDVEPGTPGAGTIDDKGSGQMMLHLDHEQAARFIVGRQYVFTTDVQPVYEGE